MTWLSPALTIARKDLRLEMRTRDVLASVGLFVLLVVVTASFAFPTGGEGREGVAAGVLWIAFLFAALLGMGRSMAIEKEDSCLEGLLVSPAPREAIFLGKLFSNLGFTFLVELAILPLFIVLLQLRPAGGIALLILGAFLGTLGIVTVGTLFAAMAVNTRGREAILPLLVMPVSVPIMVAAVKVSEAGFLAGWGSGTTSWLLLMVGYDALFLLVALATFHHVMEE
ncbi:MAG TPA: heme exporter protein CcmB [Actinomycetota bacterium]|jgi:heme exporter protein B|nr:heme exporter protein CcmB [Actinomycetota bacterium]